MKMKRFISIAFSVALLVALLCSPAHAATPRASIGTFYTPAMIAGEEWSGLSANRVHNMDCEPKSSPNPYSYTGVDINISFTRTGTGMPEGFIQDTTRTAKITVREEDSGSNPNETLFDCTATFGMVNGHYALRTFGTRSNVNEDEIEDNSCLELYLLVTVDTKLGDYNTDVPEDLFGYSFRTTY